MRIASTAGGYPNRPPFTAASKSSRHRVRGEGLSMHRAAALVFTLWAVGLLAPLTVRAAEDLPTRWHLDSDGIVWDVRPGELHRDFVEMNGEQVGLVVQYGTDAQGTFTVNPDVVWPMLRFEPNLTGSHVRQSFGEDARIQPDSRFSPGISPPLFVRTQVQWQPVNARVLRKVRLHGLLQLDGTLEVEDGPSLEFHRTVFPSVDKPLAIDTTVIVNTTTDDVRLTVDDYGQSWSTDAERGVYGGYVITERTIGAGDRTLHPGGSTRVSTVFAAAKQGEGPLQVDIGAEERARRQRVDEIDGELVLETPDPVLNAAFQFAKLHATESLFRTKAGLLPSPGGGRDYYAAIWANDQAEYADPFFGMLGDPLATTGALNSFRQFARFMNKNYAPIPSSIISEGEGTWHGAGDRGDMAMIAYGASRFAMGNGDRKAAEELWPLIEWSLEYLRRHVNAQGVVVSDSDELEGRFPAGRANLNTSCLYFDALRSAAMLGANLGKDKSLLADYARRATAIHAAIERHFGARVEGFRTYRYYDKTDLANNPDAKVAAYAARPDVLRAWIATPLAMGISDRRSGTLDALFSPELWTSDGLASEAGGQIYWDRSTLYALRGALSAGDTERALTHLGGYSRRRLLGEHVPYPFEAYPEGGKAQLAAESALYCRIFTEGLFGIRPTGLRSFELSPRLPAGWPSMALTRVRAFGRQFDLRVRRVHGTTLEVTIMETVGSDTIRRYRISAGSTRSIEL